MVSIKQDTLDKTSTITCSYKHHLMSLKPDLDKTLSTQNKTQDTENAYNKAKETFKQEKSDKTSPLYCRFVAPTSPGSGDTTLSFSFRRKHWKAQNQSLSSERPDFYFKFIMIGDSCTGKTSLAWTFCRKIGAPVRPKSPGGGHIKAIEYTEKVLQASCGKRVLARLYDTAGQEKYRSLTASYYRGAHGCLILYDVTKESSFENLGYWLHDLKEYTSTPEISTIIVGTKCHVAEDKREVTYERAQKFAESVGVPYMEVSAEEGTNVTEVFEKLADLIIDSMPKAQASMDMQKSVRLDQTPPKKHQWCSC